jgi:hypothetical protein
VGKNFWGIYAPLNTVQLNERGLRRMPKVSPRNGVEENGLLAELDRLEKVFAI